VLDVVQERDLVVIAAEQEDLSPERAKPVEGSAGAVRKIPLVLRHQTIGMRTRSGESRDVVVDDGARERPEELDQNAMRAGRPRRQRIERWLLFEDLLFLFRREHSPTNVVVVVRTADIHHQRARRAEHVAQRKMDLIGAAGHLSSASHRRMEHHDIARDYAKRTKVSSKLLSRPHLFALCPLLSALLCSALLCSLPYVRHRS